MLSGGWNYVAPIWQTNPFFAYELIDLKPSSPCIVIPSTNETGLWIIIEWYKVKLILG